MIVAAAPNAQQQVSRPVLGLLLLGAAVAVAPHFVRLFPGLSVFGAIAIGWGAMVQAGRWPPPGVLVKAALACTGFGVVFVTSRHPFAIEPMIGLLLVAYQLKLVETTRRRDGFVVAFMAYFVIATHFLFDQSLAMAAYALLAVILVTGALVGQTQSATVIRPRQLVAMALRMTLPAVPLAAVVFLLFPRVSPLWNVPIPSTARTGLAETLRPQDVAALSRNPEVAFRVEFEGIPPPVAERYWRSLVYYGFIDESWEVAPAIEVSLAERVDWHAGRERAPWAGAVLPQGDGYRYRVIMEPTDQRWLYALGSASSPRQDIGTTRDGRLVVRDPIVAKFGYAANSTLTVPGDLPDWMRSRSLQLPSGGNPRARQLAGQLRERAGNDAGFVAAAFDFYRRGGFVYTLTPAAIPGDDSIDGFLFGPRRGFCAHYAGSLVFLARAAGIPARLVGGYLGGEQNVLSNFVTVRQYDAHAWAELWLGERGWVRVDPTAVVAPERISRGVEAMGEGQLGVFSTPWGVRRMAGLAYVFGALDSLEHQWNEWVVGYDAEFQARLLSGWIGKGAWRTAGLLLVGAIAATLASYALVVISVNWWRQRRLRSPARGLERWGAGQGWPRRLDETLAAYAARLAHALPADAALIRAVAAECAQMLYVDPSPATRRRTLRLKLLRLRWTAGVPGLRNVLRRAAS